MILLSVLFTVLRASVEPRTPIEQSALYAFCNGDEDLLSIAKMHIGLHDEDTALESLKERHPFHVAEYAELLGAPFREEMSRFEAENVRSGRPFEVIAFGDIFDAIDFASWSSSRLLLNLLTEQCRKTKCSLIEKKIWRHVSTFYLVFALLERKDPKLSSIEISKLMEVMYVEMPEEAVFPAGFFTAEKKSEAMLAHVTRTKDSKFLVRLFHKIDSQGFYFDELEPRALYEERVMSLDELRAHDFFLLSDVEPGLNTALAQARLFPSNTCFTPGRITEEHFRLASEPYNALISLLRFYSPSLEIEIKGALLRDLNGRALKKSKDFLAGYEIVGRYDGLLDWISRKAFETLEGHFNAVASLPDFKLQYRLILEKEFPPLKQELRLFEEHKESSALLESCVLNGAIPDLTCFEKIVIGLERKLHVKDPYYATVLSWVSNHLYRLELPPPDIATVIKHRFKDMPKDLQRLIHRQSLKFVHPEVDFEVFERMCAKGKWTLKEAEQWATCLEHENYKKSKK